MALIRYKNRAIDCRPLDSADILIKFSAGNGGDAHIKPQSLKTNSYVAT